MKLLVQPQDGIEPLLSAINGAKKYIDILIFRLDFKELETALKAASDRGVAVRALIAQTNRGGEPKLRNLEMRFLEAGIVVGRTANDLIRYHGKMMIVDRKTLFLLSFNFVHLDIDHSRGFGIVTTHANTVAEAVKLFEADINRTPYVPGLSTFVVSPVNAREQLTQFLNKARKQILIYDPKIADTQMIRLLQERAAKGIEVKIIGSIDARKANLPVAPLTAMRLHTRTIIVDGKQAFVGSQSLRQAELESRREIGIIIREPKVVKGLVETFEKDWASTGFDEASPEAVAQQPDEAAEKAARALAKQMRPMTVIVKKAIREAVSKAGKDAKSHPDVESTVKSAVKAAVKEVVRELVPQE